MGASGNIPGDSNALQVQIPCIIFFVLTPFFMTVRIWSRIGMRLGLGWDDWTILLSFACCLAVSVLMMASVHYGFGQHIYNLSTENRLMTMKLFYVAQIFYKLTINLTKASILLLYLRIFPSRPFRAACLALMVVILLYMLGTSASSVWQCAPVARAWDRSIPGTCISLTANWYANAAFSIATDVAIILLPQRVIWTSQLPIAQKRALMAVFGLGVFVTITSVLRMTTLNFSTTSPDPTYDIASTLWTMIEMHVAIICACLPMLRVPLAYLFPSILGSSTSKSHPSSSNTSGSTDPYRSIKSRDGGAPPHQHQNQPLPPSSSSFASQLVVGGTHSPKIPSWARDDEEKGVTEVVSPTSSSSSPRGGGISISVGRRDSGSEEIMLRPMAGATLEEVPEEKEEEHGRHQDGRLRAWSGGAASGKRESGIRKTTWFEMRSEQAVVPGQAL